MHSLPKLSFFLLAGLLAWPTAGRAQESGDPNALPDLAPREFDIRGQLDIVFPSLERQPLVGFNPPPRVPEIPASRRPYAEPFNESKIALPPSPLRPPEPPQVSPLAGKEPIDGEFEAQAGRYLSRLFKARAGLPLSEDASAFGRLDYRGTDGHRPYDDDPDIQAPFDTFEGTVGFQARRARLAFGLEAGGLLDRYTLYAARIGASPDPLALIPDRDVAGGQGALWLRTQGDAPLDAHLRLHYGSARADTDIQPDEDPAAAVSLSEQRFSLTGDLDAPVPFGRAYALTRFDLLRHNAASATTPDATTTTIDAGTGVRLGAGNRYRLHLGVRLLSYTLGAGFGRVADQSRTFLSPDVRLELFPLQGLRLYAQNRPGLNLNALPDLLRENPYLVPTPDLAPSVRLLDAEAGVQYFAGRVQLAGRAGYRDVPNFLFFEDATTAEARGYSRGFSAVRYEDAQVLFASGDVSVVLPGGFQATLGATLRDGQLKDSDDEIPYFGALLGRALLAYSFAQSKGLLQLVGNYESARERDRDGTRTIGDFFDLDLYASYHVTPAIGLVLGLDNISANRLERWDGYTLAPLVLTGGLRVRW